METKYTHCTHCGSGTSNKKYLYKYPLWMGEPYDCGCWSKTQIYRTLLCIEREKQQKTEAKLLIKGVYQDPTKMKTLKNKRSKIQVISNLSNLKELRGSPITNLDCVGNNSCKANTKCNK